MGDPAATAFAQARASLQAEAEQAKRDEFSARRRARRKRRELAALESRMRDLGIEFVNLTDIDTGPGGSHSHDEAATS